MVICKIRDNGDFYLSEFDKDKKVREGRGIYIWRDGDRYDGFWHKGL